MITAVVSHNAFHGCHKCETVGVYVRNLGGRGGGSGKYPETCAELRTNEKFRAGIYELHYNRKKDKSALLQIDYLDMVQSFPLDFMHLVCLGVMRKLLNIWVYGSFDKRRISKESGRVFEHFLLLHVAIRLLHRESKFSPTLLNYANTLRHIRNSKY